MGEDKKDQEKKEEQNPEIVLKVDMHCEACARKVERTLKGVQGVEAVATDTKENKVVVKGKTANPNKVYERLIKKYGRKVELVSPLPLPPPPVEEEKKEENKESKPTEEKKEEPPPPPAVITVVLKVGMHCEACAQLLRKRIRKIKGVESVETDVGNDQVVVKGTVDPATLVAYVNKRTGKQATIVKGEEKKEEEKKEQETNKESEEAKGGEKDDKQSEDMKRSDNLPSKYYSEFEYPQFFSDENPNACSLM